MEGGVNGKQRWEQSAGVDREHSPMLENQLGEDLDQTAGEET